METATEKANQRLTVWERITSIVPAGRKPCACIAVSGKSRLYITDGGIITHNTAGDPRNPLPQSYVDRNGRIKVLATVPDVERKAAAMEAIPVSQEVPDFEAIYQEAAPEVRKRVVDRFLRSRAADAVTRNSNLAEITTEQEDTRLASLGNQNGKNLVAVHNLSTANLKHVLKMGGIAVPSMAIIRADMSKFDNFGEVTLVAKPDLIDPKRDSSVKVFNADVYSPRYPSVKVELDPASKKQFASFLKGTEIAASGNYSETIDGLLNGIKDDGFQGTLENSSRVMLKYLQENGIQFSINETEDGWRSKMRLRKAVRGEEDNGIPFAEWVEALPEREGWQTKEQIFDGFTNSGNRKYLRHDLDTVVRILKRGLKDGEGFNYGVPSVRAVTAKKFRTVEQIQKARQDIIQKEQMDALKEEVDKEFLALAEEVAPDRSLDSFSDDMKAMAQGGSENFRHLRDMYPDGVPFEKMRTFLEKLKNMPTEYFEAKIQRAVQLQEFESAVVPSDTAPMLLAALKKRGLSIFEYKRGDLESRRIATESAATKSNALFSQSISPFNQIDELARKAYAETKAGGPRTVGDPKLSHSQDTDHWRALDEYRKTIFQRQKESDWLAMADKMLAADYTATLNGIFAKLNARETLLPWETKAAEKIIAAEMSKDLYGSPEADKRRRTLYSLVFGLRQTRAETARSLAAFRDPHYTPEERMRAFAGELIFTPSAAAERKAAGLTSESEKDRRIATLEERLATLRDMAKTSQEQHEEIARLNRDLSEARAEATKEDVFRADADERYARVEKRLRELGVRIEDLMSKQVEVRLMGAKIVGDIAANFNDTERSVIALSLAKRGGNIADIAERMEISASDVRRILQEYQDAMKAELVKKFKLKAMGLDNLLVGGIGKAIKSAPAPDERSDFEAEELALRAMREMGIIPVEEHDTTIVRTTKPKKKLPLPKKKDNIGMPAWAYPAGPGASVETMLEKHSLVWQEAPTGEGKVTPGGKLDLGERAWEGAPTGEGKLKPDGSLDLTGPSQPHQFETGRFDFDDAAQRLQAMRLMQSAANGSTVFDYASEIVIANLLSAPTTAITNITGYLYGIYRFTFRRAMEAALNFDKNTGAATFGEFRPMLSAVASNMGTAFSNALLAWSTETPVTEALRRHMQQDLGMSFDEPIGKIPGKFGRFVRMPMRFLLATDEFAKTLLARSHAAAIAHRMGRARGFEGNRLASYINGQLGDTTSAIWDVALQEARHVTFQDKLRTFAQVDAEEIGTLNKATHSLEAIMAQLTKYKNDAGPDAGLVHNLSAFVLRATFPFIKTPYNLLYIGLKESPLGGIWEAVRQKGGFAGNERIKGPLVLDKEKAERDIARLKREAGTAKNSDDREKAIRKLQAARKTLAEIEALRAADPKRGYLFGKADSGKNVNARAAILTSAILTAALWAFGEGDDDDDEKSIIVTGSTPQKDPKAQGQRELRQRTIPEQSIRIRFGGKEFTMSYRRLDPFSTTLATVVDTLASIKGISKGRSAWEAYGRAGSSLMTQIMDKASLRGFSEVANIILGGKSPTTSDAANTLAAWAVPNAIRNPLRNSDPMVRDTDYFGDDAAARVLYAALPSEKNAPPARRDLYGKPIEQLGSAVSRIAVPGQPHEQGAFSREDITIRNWNLQNPAAPVAPETPDVKDIVKRYKATPAQADRWMKARGEYISREIRAKGLSGLKRPTAAQMDELEKIVGRATAEARKQVFGK